MTTVVSPGVEERLDRISTDLAAIAEEVRRQGAARERWAELADDLAPVTAQAMKGLTDELADLDGELDTEDVVRLLRTLARSVRRLESALALLESMSALGAELTGLTGPAMRTLTDQLQTLEARGYFSFARQGAAIADTIVTSFTEDDVRALGDNIVLILRTVRELTQPEVMALLRRTALTAQRVDDVTEPPSTLSLLRQLRDPHVRLGLARTLSVLRTVGAETERAESQPAER